MTDVADATPQQTYDALRDDPAAEIVDVRTDAEWAYVGVPDLAGTGKTLHRIAWQIFPAMTVNDGFVAALGEAGLTPDRKLYFLCRSGVRSLAAARAAIAAGYGHGFNIAGGFEGPADAQGHRRTMSGWIAEGLPWRQG